MVPRLLARTESQMFPLTAAPQCGALPCSCSSPETEAEADVQEDASTDSNAAESDASTEVDAPAAEAKAQTDAPSAKTDANAEAQTQTEAQLPNDQSAQPKIDESSNEEEISTGSTGKANKGRNKNSQEWDPAVNPDCAPLQ